MSALLEVDELRVFYRKVEGLHRASLRMEEGSVVTVIGPNGAGKTTLLGGFHRRREGGRALAADMAQVYARFPKLEERASQLAGTLSGGERQMLALGRALMAKPRLLMLDEPSLGLAPRVVRDIYRIIADLKRSGVSILLVEQNARAALQVADRGYVLETGQITLEGSAAELAANPRVIESYLGLSARVSQTL